MKPRVSIGLAVGIVVLTCPPLRAQTEVGGLICSNTTWDLAGSPYLVTVDAGGSIMVGCDATLTIEADVEVRFRSNLGLTVGHAVWGAGTLVARGTAQSPIRFTTNDPYEDPPGTPDPGDWVRIYFTDYATDAEYDEFGEYASGCVLEHVIVEYSGSGGSAITAQSCSPYLAYCEVHDNANGGIDIAATGAGEVKIEYCQVHGHSQRGISISDGVNHEVLNNEVYDNANTGIHIWGPSQIEVSGNHIHNNGGGGLVLADAHSATVAGNLIEQNTSGEGAGIRSWYSEDVVFQSNTVTGNSSSGSGGGVDLFCMGTGNSVEQNTVSLNHSSGNGGGISMDNGCSTAQGPNRTLINNSIIENTANGRGGGVYVDRVTVTLLGNSISKNYAGTDGGGGYIGGDYGSQGSDDNVITSNTINENTATGNGGGLYLRYSDRNTLTSNMITDNTAGGNTGGIYVVNSTSLSFAGDPVTARYNVISTDNDGYCVYNDNTFDPGGSGDIDARYVKWCTDDTQVIQDRIYDYFDNATKSFVFWYPFVPPGDGDFDDDGDVDLGDYAEFAVCFSGPDEPMLPGCEDAALDCDNDVDLVDFAAFQVAFTGP